jgi:hypothetical protein
MSKTIAALPSDFILGVLVGASLLSLGLLMLEDPPAKPEPPSLFSLLDPWPPTEKQALWEYCDFLAMTRQGPAGERLVSPPECAGWAKVKVPNPRREDRP